MVERRRIFDPIPQRTLHGLHREQPTGHRQLWSRDVVETLKAKYGDSYERRMERARAMFKNVSQDDLGEFDEEFGSEATFEEVFKMSEDLFGPGEELSEGRVQFGKSERLAEAPSIAAMGTSPRFPRGASAVSRGRARPAQRIVVGEKSRVHPIRGAA